MTPAQYFSRKRGLANGIVYASGGLGGTVISFAMDGLIARLGPAWTFRIIGFMTLGTGLPAAWLIKERAPIKGRAFIDLLVPAERTQGELNVDGKQRQCAPERLKFHHNIPKWSTCDSPYPSQLRPT